MREDKDTVGMGGFRGHKLFGRGIARGVVDAHHLVIDAIERRVHFVQQGGDIPRLVIERYEHCKGAARLGRNGRSHERSGNLRS